MGFTTWPYGTTAADRDTTYQFIQEHADFYTEHLDDKIPWSSWINSSPLPQEFIDDMDYRASAKPSGHELLVSVSLLNNARSDLAEDFDGSVPAYSKLSDKHIENAYFEHVEYITKKLEPEYLLLSLECNELIINAPDKWEDYKTLMSSLRARIKATFPDILVSESVTLHNWYAPDVENPEALINEIDNYINLHDFVGVSYYPFFKGQKQQNEFQLAFDFLHSKTNQPIAFTETAHLAEDLTVESYNLNIRSNTCEQKEYLETLMLNASQENYLFITWWAHRDFDALWETFPDELKDLGKLWRDTGIIDEDGNERPAFETWTKILSY